MQIKLNSYVAWYIIVTSKHIIIRLIIMVTSQAFCSYVYVVFTPVTAIPAVGVRCVLRTLGPAGILDSMQAIFINKH